MIHIHWASRFMFLQVAWAITITCKSPQWSLFFKVCQKLFFFYPPPSAGFSLWNLALPKCSTTVQRLIFLSAVTDANIHSGTGGRSPRRFVSCVLVWTKGDVCLEGVFFQADGGCRSYWLKWRSGWFGGGCSTSQTWSWSLVFTKDVESPLKACGVPWEMVGFGWF